MFWICIFVGIAIVLLACNKVTHVLAYAVLCSLAMVFATFASILTTHLGLEDWQWKEYSKVQCNNAKIWNDKGSIYCEYYRQKGSVLTYCLEYTYALKSVDGMSVPQIVTYKRYANPSSKQFYWGTGWFGDGTGDAGTYYSELEVSPEMAKQIIERK